MMQRRHLPAGNLLVLLRIQFEHAQQSPFTERDELAVVASSLLGRAGARGAEVVFKERRCAGVFGFREVSF